MVSVGAVDEALLDEVSFNELLKADCSRTLHIKLNENLLGMSFLDRLESWEVRADRLMLNAKKPIRPIPKKHWRFDRRSRYR